MNKIVKGKKNEEKVDSSLLNDTLRLNSTLKGVQEDADLKHYGVIGQRWGVTNDSPNSVEKASRSLAVKNRRLLSDDELSNLVKRLEMEKKLSELASSDLEPGKKLVASQSGKLLAAALGSAAGLLGATLMKAYLKKKGLNP